MNMKSNFNGAAILLLTIIEAYDIFRIIFDYFIKGINKI